MLCTGGLCSPSRITRKKSDDRCGTRPRWLRRVSRLRSSTLAPASRRHLYTRAAPQSTPAGAGADGDRTARSRRSRAGTRTPRTILPRIGGCFPRHAHGWRRTAATVTPATSSKSSLAVAGLERPAPRTRRSRWRATPGGRYGRMAPLSGRGLPSFTTRRHAVPAGRVRERVVPVAGHAERQPALPGASAELPATTDAGLRGGR